MVVPPRRCSEHHFDHQQTNMSVLWLLMCQNELEELGLCTSEKYWFECLNFVSIEKCKHAYNERVFFIPSLTSRTSSIQDIQAVEFYWAKKQYPTLNCQVMLNGFTGMKYHHLAGPSGWRHMGTFLDVVHLAEIPEVYRSKKNIPSNLEQPRNQIN